MESREGVRLHDAPPSPFGREGLPPNRAGNRSTAAPYFLSTASRPDHTSPRSLTTARSAGASSAEVGASAIPRMSPHACTKDQLVEQPAIGLFTALGWQTVSAMEETPATGGTLTANWEQFVQWKLMTRHDTPRPVSPEVMLRQPRKFPRLSRRIVCSDRAGAGCFMGLMGPIGPIGPMGRISLMGPMGPISSTGFGKPFMPDACGSTDSLRKSST